MFILKHSDEDYTQLYLTHFNCNNHRICILMIIFILLILFNLSIFHIKLNNNKIKNKKY